MKSFIRAAGEHLRKRGYHAPEQEIKRAYWRQAKRQNAGICALAGAEYLIFNRIAQPVKRAGNT